MGPIIEKMVRFFDRQNLPVSVVGRMGEAIRLTRGVPGVPEDVMVLIITDEDDPSSRQVQIRIMGLCRVPEASLPVLQVLNEANGRMRWFKACLNPDNEVDLAADILVNMTAPENEIFELMTLGLKLCESIYPDLRKAMEA